MITLGDCGGSILRKSNLVDILQPYGGNAKDETPFNQNNTEAEKNRRGNNDVIDLVLDKFVHELYFINQKHVHANTNRVMIY